MLHRGVNCGSDVDGCVLRFVTDEMESSSRAGQVALGHVSTIIMLELFGFMRRLSGGLTSRCIRSDPDVTINHDAVHGLRAAPEPDAALRETFEVSQFVALVE